jgi:hypothetical protein
MTQAFERLRGNGTKLQWSDAIEAAIETCREVWRNYGAKKWIYMREAASREAAKLFASLNGWTHRDAHVHLSRLMCSRCRREYERNRGRWGSSSTWMDQNGVVDHPQWFFIGRKVAACAVHLYSSGIKLNALPPCIDVDRLPNSFYYPDVTTGYLLRPSGFNCDLKPRSRRARKHCADSDPKPHREAPVSHDL